MNQDIKPSSIMMMGGGAVLLISTFLHWFSSGSRGVSGWNTDAAGLSGILVALIGVMVAGGVASTQFANVSLPERILGFTQSQVYCILGFSAFLITFGRQFETFSGIGILLGWISSAVIVAGAYMEMQASGAGSTPPAPPSQF